MENIEETAQTNNQEIDLTKLAESKENEFSSGEIEEANKDMPAEKNQTKLANDNENIKKVQTEEENSAYARRRREIEQKQKIEEVSNDVKIDIVKKILNGVNPYSGKTIETIEDVNEYLIANETHQSEKWYIEDRTKFLTTFNMTENEMNKIFEDENFSMFAEGKVGKQSLVDIYQNYVNMINYFEELARTKAEKIFLNSKSSPGSLSSNQLSKSNSWSDLSDKEFEDAIRKAKSGYYSKKLF